MTPHVRWMIRRDMPEVVAIERECAVEPIGEDGIVGLLRQRHIIGMVAEQDDAIVGFMIYELHKHRIVVVAGGVRGDVRMQGIGLSLMRKLRSKLFHGRRTRIVVNVPEDSLGTLKALSRLGFRAVRMLRGEFGNSDGICMVYRLNAAVAAAEHQDQPASESPKYRGATQ